MLNISSDDVNVDPFPHVISNQILDPDFYARLRADYPTASIFEDQKSETGLGGSRTGQGFDIYRGDTAYEALIKQSDAWAEFDDWINSSAFVDKFLELFGPYLGDIGCRAEISSSNYHRGYVEGREVMTPKPSMKDRLNKFKRSFQPKNGSIGAVDLFTRLDIHKALKGYNKDVHCDRGNRLCSFIIYFVDAEKEGIEGGDLTIHKHVSEKRPFDYERHPEPKDAPVVATLKPKENTGVLFPCCNNSYHGVTAMQSNGKERDYLYINISGDVDTLW